jgi:alpha-mannosidase
VLDLLERATEFRHFLLDGQSIILEDYLEIRPEEAPRVKRQVERGGLSVGPWYVLPDEFLVSGESTVRNLQLGHKIAEEYGGVQKVGYMPDSFGHIAQLPQILTGVGIDSFIYTRGSGDEIESLGYEYRWKAPDGSEVLAINQCGGYCNAGGLGHGEEWEVHTQRSIDLRLVRERIRALFDRMGRLSRGDIYLLCNGCDHFPPQREFDNILAGLRREFPTTLFSHASLSEYIGAVRRAGFAAMQYSGELLGGRHHFILSGVWSSRMYLKQWNDRAQTLLSNYVEPIVAYTHFCLGREYPRGLIEHSWRLLLQNHPHDSICGCSTDEVHLQMAPRFAGVVDTGEQVLRDVLVYLTPTFARSQQHDIHTAICVLNPLPLSRTEVVERLLVLQPLDVDTTRLCLFDERGGRVPLEIVDHWYMDRFWGFDYRTELTGESQRRLLRSSQDHFGDRIHKGDRAGKCRDRLLLMRFVARDLPPAGHRQFFLREDRAGDATQRRSSGIEVTADCVMVSDNSLENEHYRVSLHRNGTLDIFDKATRRTFLGLNRLEDTEDIGDEYDYSPCAHSKTITSDESVGKLRTIDEGFYGRIECEFELNLPRCIGASRGSRVADSVVCRAQVRVGLGSGSRVIEVELLFDNAAKDHRLRVEFPTGIITETVVSDGHYYVNHRSIEQPAGSDWKQPPAGTFPQQDFTLVQDGSGGLAILNRGLPEIQAKRSGSGEVTLSLTLLRAVGWLSRDDFATRRFSGAGPHLPTPDAQCLREHRFEYAVLPFAGDYVGADVKGIAQRYRTPVLSIQGVEDQHVPGGPGLLQQTTSRTCISAIKQHDVRDTLLVRLYNLTSEAVEETLVFGRAIAAAWLTDLLEEREEELPAKSKDELVVVLGAHAIRCVEVEFS